jgi:two-component system, cell cycle response regulator DivK
MIMPAKILYVEDNVLNMRLVRKLLMSAGYTMIEAVDGRSGVKLAETEKPDLILMDINLPDIDGIEATRQLKSCSELANIPVIALTANAMHGDRERFMSSGCDGYIAKPIARRELLDAISELLNQTRV